MTAPSDLSVVIGLALLTTDRDPDEDAALARVIAVAGLGDLFPGTQGTPAVSSLADGASLRQVAERVGMTHGGVARVRDRT